MGGPRPRSLEEVVAGIRARLDTSGGPDACHPFTGSRNPKSGYGMVQARGVWKNPQAVHVVIYEDVNGPVPDGHEVRHTCDNPPCANERHLISGTHQQNMQDAIDRGRFKIGGDWRRFKAS